MPRVSNGVARLRKKRRLMKSVKGYWGGRSKLLRTAKESRVRAEAYATKHRRKKKGEWRRLWIVRINAACRARGMNYSRFILGLGQAEIGLNRKMLADIAVRDASAFDDLVSQAQKALSKAG